MACEQPADTVTGGVDCDDSVEFLFADVTEYCIGEDDDCDTEIDEDALDFSTFYADVDADGFGDAGVAERAFSPSVGFVADGTDCPDSNAGVFPGAKETCSGGDNDGFGDAEVRDRSCVIPAGFVADWNDCDDTKVEVSPDGIDVCVVVRTKVVTM